MLSVIVYSIIYCSVMIFGVDAAEGWYDTFVNLRFEPSWHYSCHHQSFTPISDCVRAKFSVKKLSWFCTE